MRELLQDGVQDQDGYRSMGCNPLGKLGTEKQWDFMFTG
jgi:hypothetical protein